MILIVTSSTDDEANSIVRELRKLKARFFRLNCDRLHDLYDLAIDPGKPAFSVRHLKTGQIISDSEITKVWWTHVNLPSEEGAIFEEYISAFIDDEYYAAAIALLAVLAVRKVPVVNHPVLHNLGGHKSFQQQIAKQSGFPLVKQVITNQAKHFLSQPWKDYAVFKPVSNSRYLEKDGKKLFVTVRDLNPNLIERIADGTLPLNIHHFQERIEIECEFRVTAFGNQVFAFRIEGAYGFDWRKYLGTIRYVQDKRFKWKKQCLDYMKRIGILMGCFDFILSKDKKLYFIECNAPGFFMFLDTRGKAGLGRAFAKYLKSGKA